MNPFLDRMMRAIKLDSRLYEEVEADENAFGQAIGIVVLSSLASGIAALTHGGSGLVGNTLSSLFSWFIWSYLIYFIGTRWLSQPRTEADYGQLLRTIGFASAPGLIAIVGIIPGLYFISSIVAGIWMLVATVVAVRQALDYNTTGRAVVVCVVGWIIYAIAQVIFRSIF